MYSPEIEKKPQPKQMFDITVAALCMGKDFGKPLVTSRGKKARFFFTDFVCTEPIHESGDYNSTASHYAGRIALQTERAWSLRLVEQGYVFDGENNKVDHYNIQHAFEWTGSDVLKATRRIVVPQETDEYGKVIKDYGYKPLELDMAELQPDYLGGMGQMHFVSEADCKQLLSEMENFRNASAKMQLEYNR